MEILSFIKEEEIINFLRSYCTASSTKNFSELSSMICEDAVFRRAEGDFHGKESIQRVIEANWISADRDSYYALSNINLVHCDQSSALVMYSYLWGGVSEGRTFNLNGIGSSLLIREEKMLKVKFEHLSN